MGKVTDAELNQAYLGSTLFVLPSTERKGFVMEGLGVVLLEAMASGVPAIGSNTGGIPDIIEDGVNGLLVPPGDPDALAEAIIRILEDQDLADRFREAGLETVKGRFSWDKISDQFIEVYREVLHESNEV
jgi:glycosyltransferase involved in cell wall biosynthesis